MVILTKNKNMHKIICFVSVLLILSCTENNNAQIEKNDNNDNNDISCQIFLHERNYSELYLKNIILKSNRADPKIIEDLELKLKIEKNKLDSLLSIFDNKKERTEDENMGLAYDNCIDLHPFKITDSLKIDELFKQYYAYINQLPDFGFDMNIEIQEFIVNIKKETEISEDCIYRYRTKGVIINLNEEEFNDYLKKQKSNYHIAYDYIVSKKNNVSKLLYNKSFSSLSEIEIFMLEFRVVNYISTHNLGRYCSYIRDEDEKLNALLKNL